jgi:hypothetical protein
MLRGFFVWVTMHGELLGQPTYVPKYLSSEDGEEEGFCLS